MDNNKLFTKFARIGARLKVADRPSRRFRAFSGVISLDVLEDREGEFFEVARRSETDPDVSVLDVQPADRHLLLLVRDGAEKQKFLCGHDERHWFVAAVPESAPVGTVRQAADPHRRPSCEGVGVAVDAAQCERQRPGKSPARRPQDDRPAWLASSSDEYGGRGQGDAERCLSGLTTQASPEKGKSNN